MSRLKIALGLIVVAGAVTLIAIAVRPSNSERIGIEQQQPAEPVAAQAKMPTVQSRKNDAILKNLVTSPGKSDRARPMRQNADQADQDALTCSVAFSSDTRRSRPTASTSRISATSAACQTGSKRSPAGVTAGRLQPQKSLS